MAKAKIEAARYPHAQALRKRVFAILALAKAVAISIQPRHHDCAEEYQFQRYFQTLVPDATCCIRFVIWISGSNGYENATAIWAPQNKEDLTFALTCLAIGIYDVFCAGLYGATSVEEGVYWQRLLIIGLGLDTIALLWFVAGTVSPGLRQLELLW